MHEDLVNTPVGTCGPQIELRYRVMRSGKRSRDGISGEAQSLYSLG